MSMPLPRLTPEALRDAMGEMCEMALQMLRKARDGFRQASPPALDEVGALGRDLHLREKRLTEHVAMQIREYPWSLGTAQHLAFLPAALERVGDSVETLARCARALLREGVPYSERGSADVMELFRRAEELLEGIVTAIRTGHRDHLSHVREAGERFQAYGDEVLLSHQDRLLRGICVARASSLFFSMLDGFREIERYTRRMSLDLEKALAAL